jgi:hypothetical protein
MVQNDGPPTSLGLSQSSFRICDAGPALEDEVPTVKNVRWWIGFCDERNPLSAHSREVASNDEMPV